MGFGMANIKTHCKNGHEFTEENSRWTIKDNGKRRRICRICNNEYHRQIRHTNPSARDKIRKYEREYKLKYKYGVTADMWRNMFEKQGGCCAGCNTSFEFVTPCVDHCHITNDFRGLLCHACNRGIGLLKDSPELLEKLATYLKNNH